MRCITLLGFFLTLSTLAQNWALINPAYRYNYNDDGSDTIKNQVLVVTIDTLAADTFRYAMPLIARLCNNCPGACNLQTNLPQFVQKECFREGERWRFNDPEELILHPQAPINTTWLFNTYSGDSGTIVEITQEPLLGVLDSIRTMATTAGDTIRWSKNHGILLWHRTGEARFQLIGVKGPDIGQLVPPMGRFFPYQPGDVVEYQYAQFANMHSFGWNYRMNVTERTEEYGKITVRGPTYRVFSFQGNPQQYTYYDSSSLSFNSLEDTWRSPFSSWPGQLITFSADSAQSMIAKHEIDAQGNYVITGQPILNGSTLFSIFHNNAPDTSGCPMAGIPDGSYLQSTAPAFGYGWNFMIEGSSYNIRGAIISGDTVGTLNSEEFFHVGIDEMHLPGGSITIAPNPACNQTAVSGLPNCATTLYLRDVTGSLEQTCTLHGPGPETVDVSHLAPGVYVIHLDGMAPQRLVIAR
ncbi:MAG: T9SS type A sorting domain-containing protein [Bacteroidetes bacterium]|nr:T9SS type A sorting domain-containing protein [Bacteroidota bacterium]